MRIERIDEILNQQRQFFFEGHTLDVAFRIKQLKKLKQVILEFEEEIQAALYEDLGKSSFESYLCEIGLVLSEISYMIKHTKKFASKRKVPTPLAQFASSSYQQPSPYGTVLVMSPWNYPFLLTMDPIVDAIAAGNTVVVKPSAYSPKTSEVMAKIIEACFDEKYVACVLGGRKENSALLEKKWDFVFFTGSQSVGKIVLKQMAEHLTPVVLELGGKSPCIVDQTANLSLAAKRIVFGKFLNCGQTCVAPDYILCHESIKDELVKELMSEIKKQYSNQPLQNRDYGKIVNEKHFQRLLSLINESKVVYGGKSDLASLKIEPTLMMDVCEDDLVMQEEIFGPILPLLTYSTVSEVITSLQRKERPLALYIFSEDASTIQQVTTKISYGGGCINDCIIHLATSEMGFGGVGESGMGSYHGKVGFDTFSHLKSIVDKKTWMDLPMRYQPYQEKYRKILRFFLK